MTKMKRLIVYVFLAAFFTSQTAYSAGPLDPVKVGTWTLNFGVGPGAHYFGNGIGFGPAEKISFEKGMWDAGPGVITLGGEAAFSFFTNKFGLGWKESWANFIFSARGAYHYGWNVEGLDTYAGLPLGIGFCSHTWESRPGNHGYSPVYPYLGFFAGASWFFTKAIGINGEVGYNATYANIGVVIKLK